jgi:hypothetical protein
MIEGLSMEDRRKRLGEIMDHGVLTSGNKEIDDELKEASRKEEENSCLKQIEHLDNNYSYDSIKKVIREKWTKDSGLRFFINKNFHIKGKVTNKIEAGIVEIPLIQQWEKVIVMRGMGDMITRNICIFGEKKQRDSVIINSLTHKFYIYRMVTKIKNHLETFMLLSEKEMNLEEYNIEGMLLGLDDFSEVSKYTKIMKKSHIVFVNNFVPSKKVYSSKEEFINYLKEYKLNEDIFFQNLLSIEMGGKRLYFQHPRYFERLLAAFFLSSKYDSSPYPLHLAIIGKQGGGKSKAMESIYDHIEEQVPIIEGSGSTMKSLIPSFKGDLTKPGTLIESNRIAFVDEFFRILMRVDKDDRQDTLTHLNPLLEHKKRRFGSGNNFLDAQMTSKLFAVTNPVFGTSNIESLTKKMDNSFLSRILIWYQDEEHYKFITSKSEEDLEEINYCVDNNSFKSIYDFCSSFKAEFNQEAYLNIYNGCKPMLLKMNMEAQGLYNSRYKHHLACLLDGIIKLRCISEGDVSFKAQKVDYENCREIWEKMLIGWKKGVENTGFTVREGRFYND